MLELIINKDSFKKQIMLIENGILIEKHEEHENHQRLEGNIYCGKVQNVLQGMQSAFINIGEDRNTFIRLKDILPKTDETKQNMDANYAINANIKDYIKPENKILIQVKRDGTAKKGARVSTHINLPGRFIVFMPNTNFITVSQKIDDNNEKERLMKVVKEVLPQGTGAIIRTACVGIEENKLKEDLEILIKKWKKIKQQYDEYNFSGPKLIYDNKALLRRTLMDIVDQKLNKVTVNDKKTFKDVSEILNNMNMKENIELELKENQDLIDLYKLNDQLAKLESRKIWLKCGGFITIDRTEALTAIDVNTGKYIGTKSLEQTVFNVNKEATLEIAKQLRLRDIGGIIIIDYIDMKEEENKNKIIELLTLNLKNDRTKSQICGFTKLNLLEMTRKNMCNNDDY
jgi:ribonuclease G